MLATTRELAGIKIKRPPAQRGDLTPAHPTENREDDRDEKRVVARLLDNVRGPGRIEHGQEPSLKESTTPQPSSRVDRGQMWQPRHTAAKLVRGPYTAAMPSNIRAGNRGGIMDYHWSERAAGTFGVNLIFAGVSVMAVYGVLNLALVTGQTLLH